jgi:hypothetical protein
MKPLIELPEVAKARIRAREAESVEQSERVRRACEGDIAPAQTFWGGYFDLHSDNLAAAVEQAGATISEDAASQLSPSSWRARPSIGRA